jgi:hypothetical protein
MMKSRKGNIAPAGRPDKMNVDECLTLVVVTWGMEFCKSSFFLSLSDEEKISSESIVGYFTELMFDYFGLTPRQWNEKPLEECCVDLFPKKMAEKTEYFRCIAPVLSAFFLYLEKEQLQPRAGAMAREVQNLHGRIIEAAEDPSSWSFAKQFVMAARADGVDVSDKKALDKFMREFNQKASKP